MDNKSNNLGDIFDKHLEFEFDKEDVDATMTTMTEDPYVHNVRTLTGEEIMTEFIISTRTTLSENCREILRSQIYHVLLEKIRS
jgi:CBS-domain-containing membrane protein